MTAPSVSVTVMLCTENTSAASSAPTMRHALGGFPRDVTNLFREERSPVVALKPASSSLGLCGCCCRWKYRSRSLRRDSGARRALLMCQSEHVECASCR